MPVLYECSLEELLEKADEINIEIELAWECKHYGLQKPNKAERSLTNAAITQYKQRTGCTTQQALLMRKIYDSANT